jgi:ergothioneine biosynthesis protein EgtB
MTLVESRVDLPATASRSSLADSYDRVRATTQFLCEPLEVEDFVVQSMPDASPAKWHLAHTSWFFEQFILKAHVRDYRSPYPQYDYLFNSYYHGIGPMHERPQRGLLTRPTVAEVMAYRAHIDAQMDELLASRSDDPQIDALTTLGINHEQQHQELLLTDLKHLFWCNPLRPAYRSQASSPSCSAQSTPMRFYTFDGGIQLIGGSSEPGQSFVFDNELPRHKVLLEPFALANRLVTNGEYIEFIRDGGYQRAEMWLSDGWSTVAQQQWARPFYWAENLDSEFTLHGMQPIEPAAPVCHLSYYEADAFARWAGARLPSEAEWEIAAAQMPIRGNLLENSVLHPCAAPDEAGHDESLIRQLFGDVWEWTASPYSPYPGYRVPPGALGEYNGKFMCNQLVLRGGSCVTPTSHIRATYRNFFYPHARWQFMGVRLARNV